MHVGFPSSSRRNKFILSLPYISVYCKFEWNHFFCFKELSHSIRKTFHCIDGLLMTAKAKVLLWFHNNQTIEK